MERTLATAEVSGPMDLMRQATISPRSHPETLMRSKSASTAPRALPAGVPGLPHPKQRGRQLQPKPASSVATPPESISTNTNPWKLTREFDEILNPYQQPELIPRVPAIQGNPEPYQQQPDHNYEAPQQLHAEKRRDLDAMADQRETLNIAYDPNWKGQPQEEPEPHSAANPPPNRFDLGYIDKKAQAVVTHQETGPESPEEQPYEPDWITAETQDITDRTYYDTDADGGSYIHQAVAVRAGAPTMINHTSFTDEDFERPRQVPAVNLRSTRIIVKEDIDFLMAVRNGNEPPPLPGHPPSLPKAEDSGRSRSPESIHQDDFVRQQDVDFYMSLLDGSDPPPASPETESLVHEEEEMRRRSEAAAAEEAERRRLEELETTKNDLNFLAELLQ